MKTESQYAYHHEGVLKLYRGELPEKPTHYDQTHSSYIAYITELESIRAKGVEIANPEKIGIAEDGSLFISENNQAPVPHIGSKEFLKVECEVREQRQVLIAEEWHDAESFHSITDTPTRTVVYLEPKKEFISKYSGDNLSPKKEPDTLKNGTLDWAIQEMARGEKVRHEYYSEKEWTKFENNEVIHEDGGRQSLEVFKVLYQHKHFKTGWCKIESNEKPEILRDLKIIS